MGEETDLIKDRLDIAEIVGEYVELKRTGQNLKALCPFHQEKTPSFIVSPQRRTWHCFGCGAGGDIFSFIQEVEGIDFPAALKLLADRAGVQLQQRSVQSTNRRQRLFDLMAAAARLYHEVLMHQRAGAKARRYLHKRGVKEPTMGQFQIGYAPNKWDFIQRWLTSKGFSEQEMIDAGIVGRSEADKVFDRFRGRVMFPITDTQGRVVAFGGRIVPWHATGNEGKYVNSPETMLYEKRRVVYNLDRAKHALRGKHPCIVVEGYMDVVMMVQVGISNVVSTSGTAFTPEQIDQISRFTDTLHFAFDADSAGVKATIAATQAALVKGMKVATIVLKEGQDPADCVLKNPGVFVNTLAKPRSLVSVLLGRLHDAENEKSREEHLRVLLPLLRHVRNPIQQGQMVQEIAHVLHVPEVRVLDLLRRAHVSRESYKTASSGTPLHSAEHSPDGEVERHLLGLIMLDTSVRSMLFEYLEEEFFLDQKSRLLYKSMQQLAQRDATFSTMTAQEFIDTLDEKGAPFAEAVRSAADELMRTTSHSAVYEGRHLFRSLQRRSLVSRLTALQDELAGGSDKERIQALQRFKTLTEQLANIDTT